MWEIQFSLKEMQQILRKAKSGKVSQDCPPTSYVFSKLGVCNLIDWFLSVDLQINITNVIDLYLLSVQQ